MARAYGANAQLLGKSESTYGTAATGDYAKLPFVSIKYGAEQGLIASDVLGQGRDPASPSRDVIKVEPEIVVPVDVVNFGQWLTWLLGAPDTTGVDPDYTHTWVSGGTSLPSASLEIGHPEIPRYFMESGVRPDRMQIEFRRSGPANATITCVAQGEASAGTSGGGTPTEATLTRFSQFQGSIKKDGSALANVTGGRIAYSNNLERIETIRADGKIDGADPTIASLTGSIDVRFADMTLVDAATNGTAIELEFAFTISATRKLVITAHEVYLPQPSRQISGPGGVQASFDWQAAKDAGLGKMMTVVLANNVASDA